MPNTLEDVRRVGQIVRVFTKHGLGPLAAQVGLAWAIPFFQRIILPKKLPEDTPVAVRESFEELGVVFIKLGQMLSLRPDLIPHEYSDEFRRLLDEVPPEPFERIKAVIEGELKKPLGQLFKEFEKTPIGSASVAQVHRARLLNGTRVVVKVQRPGIREQFAIDIELIHFLAYKLDRRFAGKEYSLTEVVKEFERYTKNELNFVYEARNIERFRQALHRRSNIVVPKVFWDRTTDKIITMDELEGTKLSELAAHPPVRLDRKAVIRNLVDLAIDQLFDMRLFHADLHPGNIIIMPGNRIGLLDFGIVGALDDSLRKAGQDLFLSIVERDSELAIRTILRVGAPSDQTDVEALKQDVRTVMGEWTDLESPQTRATHLLHVLLNQAVKHRVRMPVDIVLLAKALLTIEGSCLALDKEFNFVEYSRPRMDALLRKQRQPGAVADAALKRGKQIGGVLAELPQEALEVFERLKTGRIKLDMRDTDMRHLGTDINMSFLRLSYALLAAALIVGGAILYNVGPKIGGYSIFTLGSIVAAAGLSVILLYNVWQEGRSLHND